mmetsp:Transcript_23291/g.26966  ORF Transcript_23291/g.26966 Transcript_23291/m.26966 type:complete len:449 (+) Transcript_23291:141-1487(+)
MTKVLTKKISKTKIIVIILTLLVVIGGGFQWKMLVTNNNDTHHYPLTGTVKHMLDRIEELERKIQQQQEELHVSTTTTATLHELVDKQKLMERVAKLEKQQQQQQKLSTTTKDNDSDYKNYINMKQKDHHQQVSALDSRIKKTYSNNKGWKIVDWKNAFTPEEEEKFSCDFTTFTSAATGKSAQMCVHTFPDFVSDSIRNRREWNDCNVLSSIWNDSTHNEKSVYVEIGANIGACVMEMLLGTEANIIAFEPHPMNLFNLKKTVSKLAPALQDRLQLVPVGLGDKEGSSTIYAANNNMGNAIIGKIIKDDNGQRFDEKLQFTVNVERLDSILYSDIDVPLMKMDAQGFECHILEGMGHIIADAVDVIKFEWAAKWLRAQNCTDFLPRLRNYNFDVYSNYDGTSRFSNLVETNPQGNDLSQDFFATKQTTTHTPPLGNSFSETNRDTSL